MPANLFSQTVTEVEHYTDRFFRFRMTRPPEFRFRSGEFAQIGLPGTPMRDYFLASPAWEETLEFFSIKVPDGTLTEPLSRILPGGTVLVGRKAAGSLVLDALLPGKRLWLFATTSGIAPFAALIREPRTYELFDEVIVTQTCRRSAELAFAQMSVDAALGDPVVGEKASGRLRLFTSATRTLHPNNGRITLLLSSGTLFKVLRVPPLDPASDRAMICGSLAMLRDMQALLTARGFDGGSEQRPGTFVLERAFAE